MRLRQNGWPVIVFATLLSTLSAALAQSDKTPTPKAQDNHSTAAKVKPKAGRVWTNEDVTELRTPADTYADQKASAKQTSSDPSSESGPASSSIHASSDPHAEAAKSLPNDPGVIEALIQKTDEDIRRKQKVVDDAVTQAVRATNDLERSALESNVQIAKVDVDSSKDELKILQDKLVELKAKTTRGAETNTSGTTP